jgi:pilus assembly protein CpaF
VLGRKRNKSVFISDREELEKVAKTDKETPNQPEEKEKVEEKKILTRQDSLDKKGIDNKDISTESEEDKQSWGPSRELGSDNRSHSLFFTPESEGKDFSSVLKDVQEYISNNYSILIYSQICSG